jgi:predicted tellurium resistance membrane protein TerC
MFDLQASDILTIGLLVLLEGVLSADNALVLAILVLTLPKPDQQRALRYGMIGAFGFRAVAVVLASYLMRLAWVKLVGGLYLAYLRPPFLVAPAGCTRRRGTSQGDVRTISVLGHRDRR